MSNSNSSDDEMSTGSTTSDKNDEGASAVADEPPVLSNGIIEFSLGPIQTQLICELCCGYFREPYTITRCLHTFCKSCLFFAVQRGQQYTCPTCDIYLGKDISKFALRDGTLEDLIDKVLFPDLLKEDEELEREFYAKRGIPIKPEYMMEDSEGENEGDSSDEDSNNHSRNYNENNDSRVISSSEKEVLFRLIPEQAPSSTSGAHLSMPPLELPYFKTSGRIRIGQLKKYLTMKLPDYVSDKIKEPTTQIDFLCNGVPVGNELSVTFITRTMWIGDDRDADNKEAVVTFTYRYTGNR